MQGGRNRTFYTTYYMLVPSHVFLETQITHIFINQFLLILLSSKFVTSVNKLYFKKKVKNIEFFEKGVPLYKLFYKYIMS